jgi:polar amino acid transport system substrate-binding protein
MPSRFARLTTFLSPAFCALLLFSSSSMAKSNSSECMSLSATGNSEYPPYLWRDSEKNDRLNGAINTIIIELGKRLKRNINLKHVGSWSRAQVEVKAANVDMIAGAFYTVPRNQWMDYIYPAFLDTTSVVWENKEVILDFSSKESLIPLKGVTVINNSFGQDFDEFAENNLDITFVASVEQAFKMLSLKRVDYVLYEKNPGLAYAADLGVSSIEPINPPVSSEGLYLTLSHKSPCNTGALRGELAKHMREMIAEGFMQKALAQGLEDWSRLKSAETTD